MAISVMEAYRRLTGAFDSGLLTIDVIEKDPEALLNVNRTQLENAYATDGSNLPEYKDTPYGIGKFYKNPLNRGRYDLSNTGKTYDSMYLNFFGKSAIVSSNGYGEQYDLGNVRGYEYLKGKIFGFYESPYLKQYRNYTLYPNMISAVISLLRG